MGDDLGRYDLAVLIAAGCTIVAIALSLHLVRSHLKCYVKPQRQRYVLRIIWMVPIYSLDSFLSLCFINWAVVFEVPRDCYESYVIYNFLALMIDYMGGETAAREFFASQPPQKHWFPFRFLGEHDMSVFLETCRLCTLQYSVVRPITALLSLGFFFAGKYDASDLSYDSAYLWIMLVNNSSVTLALYYLIYFYHAALPCEPLQQCRPLAKFLAVKLVVFFCFWQYTFISLLTSFGVIARDLAHRSTNATQTGLTDFIVCIEMALFACIHECVFPASEHLKSANRASPGGSSASLSKGPGPGSSVVNPVHQARHPGSSHTPMTSFADGPALPYDAAFRDMFFVGDVRADLARVCREGPRVLYYGFSQVNIARKQRNEQRREKRLKTSRRRANDSSPAGSDQGTDDELELPGIPSTRSSNSGGTPTGIPNWGNFPPAPAPAPPPNGGSSDAQLDEWWNSV